jgi:hypothetical protein
MLTMLTIGKVVPAGCGMKRPATFHSGPPGQNCRPAKCRRAAASLCLTRSAMRSPRLMIVATPLPSSNPILFGPPSSASVFSTVAPTNGVPSSVTATLLSGTKVTRPSAPRSNMPRCSGPIVMRRPLLPAVPA